jgi:hypothetical protein
MATGNPLTDRQIKKLYQEDYLPQIAPGGEWEQWLCGYVETLESIRERRPDLTSPETQQLLWEDNRISGAGMCSVQLAPAIADEAFRTAVSGILAESLPTEPAARARHLCDIHLRLCKECESHLKRMPWVKIMRAMAAAYPDSVTCVVDLTRLHILSKGLLPGLGSGDLSRDNSPALHLRILERVDAALGNPFGDGDARWAKRSMFAWHLFKTINKQKVDGDGADQEEQRPGQEVPEIRFLPQERRRSGLTAINGYLNTALKLLDYTESGVKLEEAVTFIQEEFPNLQRSSAKGYVGIVRHQLGLLALDGEVLRPSSLGRRCLDSEEIEEVQSLLVPRILKTVNGYDCILVFLKEKGSASKAELMAALRRHYRPWTTDFAPSAQVKWAEALGLIKSEESDISLTDAGRYWAAAVPRDLQPVPMASTPIAPDDATGRDRAYSEPPLSVLLDRIASRPYIFPRELLVRVHAALHAHPRKHFVLLSGLSGTGKTKLAQLYAEACHDIRPGESNDFFRLIAVQPDWTDPTGLLGYINPLNEEPRYEVTECLRFLQHCHEYPGHPHFLCLDEMNLARVEYYFAPFLSAMESCHPIQIHQQPEAVDGVEPQINWPDNLYIMGTVNMDETTHAFSDKVLDRAFTLEFWDVDLDAFTRQFIAARPEEQRGLLSQAFADLKSISDILLPVHLHFGYRTAEEVALFVCCNADCGDLALTDKSSLDHAVFMKVLPKVRGQDTPSLRRCLKELDAFADGHGMPETRRKVGMMLEELVATGTMRFWR